MAVEKRPINIYLEANPNPNSLKFVVNFMLLPEGASQDFPDKESAKDAPLALQLFDFPYVKRVFYMSNFITVTKDENVDWIEIQEEVKRTIATFLEDGKQILNQADFTNEVSTDDTEVEAKIKNILDEYIRPAVESDGGAISFHSIDDEGIVKVLLQGSCSGCPSSTLTLKAGIENLLKRMLPEDVKEVVAEGV